MSNEDLMQTLRRQCLTDAADHLEAIRQALPTLATDLVAALTTIMKSCHSLKGDSQAVGFSSVAKFLHELESVIARIEGQVLAAGTVASPPGEIDVLEFLLSDAIQSLELYFQDLKSAPDDSEALFTKRIGAVKALDFWSPVVAPVAPAVAPMAPAVPGVAPTMEAAPPAPELPEPVDPLPNVVKESASASEPQEKPHKEVEPEEETLPDAEETGQELFLLCTNRERSVAVPITKVLEVVQSQVWNALPMPRNGVLGLLNLRGEVMPIVSVSGIVSAGGTQMNGFIIVCAGTRGRFGFRVDKAEQIIELDRSRFQKASELQIFDQAGAVTHFCIHGDTTLMILDVDKALAS